MGTHCSKGEDMDMDAMYAGPWVGEFGWELCWWNPMIRHYSKQYGYTTVSAPESSRYLYEFADNFIPLKAKGITYWEGELEGEPPVVIEQFSMTPEHEFARHINEPERVSAKRSWRSLAPENPVKVADVLCAFRPEKSIRNRPIPGKSYPFQKCQEIVNHLIARGLSVACIGGIENFCPTGAYDLRCTSLEKLCSAIAGARCVVGSSSGPIHLASLCECPHVTWIASPHHTLEQRYTKLWNPFDTPVKFVCHSRLPSPEEVVQHAENLLRPETKEGI